MKKSITILTILLLFPIISAVQFDMKSEFSQGETIIAKVSGNFLEPILRENIFFYRGHVRTSFDYDVTQIDDEFYIYALLNRNRNNYSMEIKGVQYMNGPEISDEDITKEFSITNNTADFFVNPGFIVTDSDFSLEVQNLLDQKMSITVKDEAVNTVDVKSGEIKKLNFEVADVDEEAFKMLELSSANTKYEIPVYVFPKGNSSYKEGREFKIEPSNLKVPMSTDSEAKRIIYIYNTGVKVLKDITLSISEELEPYVLFETYEIEEIGPSSNKKVEVYFSSDSIEKTIQGAITAEENGIYAYSQVSLDFIQNYIPLEGEEEEGAKELVETSETCEQLEGKICTEEETCNEEVLAAKDDFCCLGSCKTPTKSSTGKIIGWGMLGVIIVLILWFFKVKYGRAKKTVNLVKIGQKK